MADRAFTRRQVLAMTALLPARAATADDRIEVVATFSILADLARNVGGERTEVASLIGPNGDVHVYSPTPAAARMLHAARLVIVNGLGLEGWMTRLVAASAGRATTVVASNGIKPRKVLDERRHDDRKPMATNPHAWQSVANAEIYVANIRDALIKVDPAGRRIYQGNASKYLAQLAALDREVRAMIDKIPPERRRVITPHDSFGYFGDAYGMEFIAPEGISTEASARDVARIIRQIRRENIPAVFLENTTDPRLMQQIARETGARIGGTLYSDALSGPDGPAGTYIEMMRHNVQELVAALAP
jgi:zinc/manganese transport system substrate-binding protein